MTRVGDAACKDISSVGAGRVDVSGRSVAENTVASSGEPDDWPKVASLGRGPGRVFCYSRARGVRRGKTDHTHTPLCRCRKGSVV